MLRSPLPGGCSSQETADITTSKLDIAESAIRGVPRLHLRAQHREMLRQMAMAWGFSISRCWIFAASRWPKAKQARQTRPRRANWGGGLSVASGKCREAEKRRGRGLMGRRATYHPARSGCSGARISDVDAVTGSRVLCGRPGPPPGAFGPPPPHLAGS